MKIQKDWTFEDAVSGLRLSVIEGKQLNHLHIEHFGTKPISGNRDFYFDKNGKFDGTGSRCRCNPEGAT